MVFSVFYGRIVIENQCTRTGNCTIKCNVFLCGSIKIYCAGVVDIVINTIYLIGRKCNIVITSIYIDSSCICKKSAIICTISNKATYRCYVVHCQSLSGANAYAAVVAAGNRLAIAVDCQLCSLQFSEGCNCRSTWTVVCYICCNIFICIHIICSCIFIEPIFIASLINKI